jgi:hypothetical protein
MRCLPFSGCLVPPTCGVIPLFHSRFGVSYLIQIPKAMRLKVNKCRAPQAPKAPRRPCGRAYKTPARQHLSWGLCFFGIDDDVSGYTLAWHSTPSKWSATRNQQRRLCPRCALLPLSSRGRSARSASRGSASASGVRSARTFPPWRLMHQTGTWP